MARKPPYDITSAEGQKRLMSESIGQAYVPPRRATAVVGDYGADPLGNDMHRMVPSGDIVNTAERIRRLARKEF